MYIHHSYIQVEINLAVTAETPLPATAQAVKGLISNYIQDGRTAAIAKRLKKNKKGGGGAQYIPRRAGRPLCGRGAVVLEHQVEGACKIVGQGAILAFMH